MSVKLADQIPADKKKSSSIPVQLHGKKFGAAPAPRGNAVASNRRPQHALCIGRQLSYFGNAAFPQCGATEVPKFCDSNYP